jgi:3-dehydroquinate dehydratase-2
MSNPRSILVISGPNLNLLGEREPEVYGTSSLDEIVSDAVVAGRELGLTVVHEQTNSSSRIVELVHEARSSHDAIIINPGAFTHYAWSIHDALRSFSGPIVEVHLSDPRRREGWRSASVVAPVASGTVAGFGRPGYRLAVLAVAALLQ